MRTFFSIVMGLVLGLGLTEMAYRYRLLPIPHDYIPREADERIGWRNKPHQPFLFLTEGASKGVFNSEGFNDVDHARAKPAGVHRIVILGNSFAECFQVSRDQAFPAKLQTLLEQRNPSQRYEVLNFGLSGNGLASNYLIYEKIARTYHPDTVILFYSFTDYVQDQDSNRSISASWNNGQLQYHVKPMEAPPGWRPSIGMILPWLWDEQVHKWKAFFSQRLWRKDTASIPSQTTPAVTTNGPIDSIIYSEPERVCAPGFYSLYRTFFQNSLRMTNTIVSDLARAVRRSNASLYVVRIPFPFEVYPKLKGDAPVESLLWKRELSKLMDANRLPYSDLTPALLAARKNDGQFLNFRFGRGHWNSTGHDVVAKHLASLILKDRTK